MEKKFVASIFVFLLLIFVHFESWSLTCLGLLLDFNTKVKGHVPDAELLNFTLSCQTTLSSSLIKIHLSLHFFLNCIQQGSKIR